MYLSELLPKSEAYEEAVSLVDLVYRKQNPMSADDVKDPLEKTEELYKTLDNNLRLIVALAKECSDMWTGGNVSELKQFIQEIASRDGLNAEHIPAVNSIVENNLSASLLNPFPGQIEAIEGLRSALMSRDGGYLRKITAVSLGWMQLIGLVLAKLFGALVSVKGSIRHISSLMLEAGLPAMIVMNPVAVAGWWSKDGGDDSIGVYRDWETDRKSVV